jgi:hypothetical protein
MCPYLKPLPGSPEPLTLLEPYLWVNTISADLRAPFVIYGTVRPPEGMLGTPASVRMALFAQAQAAIAAAGEAGYRHGAHPELEIYGDIARGAAEDGGDLLRAEARLRLYLVPPP